MEHCTISRELFDKNREFFTYRYGVKGLFHPIEFNFNNDIIIVNMRILRWLLLTTLALKKFGYSDNAIVYTSGYIKNIGEWFDEINDEYNPRLLPCWSLAPVDFFGPYPESNAWKTIRRQILFIGYLRRWQRRMLPYIRLKMEYRKRNKSMLNYFVDIQIYGKRRRE